MARISIPIIVAISSLQIAAALGDGGLCMSPEIHCALTTSHGGTTCDGHSDAEGDGTHGFGDIHCHHDDMDHGACVNAFALADAPVQPSCRTALQSSVVVSLPMAVPPDMGDLVRPGAPPAVARISQVVLRTVRLLT